MAVWFARVCFRAMQTLQGLGLEFRGVELEGAQVDRQG